MVTSCSKHHVQHPGWHQGNGEMPSGRGARRKGMVPGGLSSALPMATRPTPSSKTLLPLPPITIFPEAIAPSPPLSLLLQPLFIGKRWERVFLGVLQPYCSPSLLSWHHPACITLNRTPWDGRIPLSATGGEREEEEGDEEPSRAHC